MRRFICRSAGNALSVSPSLGYCSIPKGVVNDGSMKTSSSGLPSPPPPSPTHSHPVRRHCSSKKSARPLAQAWRQKQTTKGRRFTSQNLVQCGYLPVRMHVFLSSSGSGSTEEDVHRLQARMPCVEVILLRIRRPDQQLYNGHRHGYMRPLAKKSGNQKIMQARRRTHRTYCTYEQSSFRLQSPAHTFGNKK